MGNMGGSSQAQDFDNSGMSGQGNLGQGFGTNQGNLGQGFDNNQGNLGRGFDNSGSMGGKSALLLCHLQRTAMCAASLARGHGGSLSFCKQD